MGLHLTAGAADLYQFIAPPIAIGFNAPLDFAAIVPGTVDTRSIPEPGTLALLAAGPRNAWRLDWPAIALIRRRLEYAA